MSESYVEGISHSDRLRENAVTLLDSQTTQIGNVESNGDSGSYKARLPPLDLNMDLNLSYLEGTGPAEDTLGPNDPYIDDDLLQDDISGSYPHQFQQPQGADNIRSMYNKGAFGAFRRANPDGTPYLEGGSFSNFSNSGSFDFPSSYPESHSVPRSMGSPHTAGGILPDDVEDDGLFIESMPGIANENFVNRIYGKTAVGETLRDPLSSSRNHSPRPFDIQPRRSSYVHEDRLTPDMHHGIPSQSYNSLSVFRDGGIGIGGRSYSRANTSNTLGEEEGWTRSHSLSRNMDTLGYTRPQYSSRGSYSSLRSGSLTRAPPGLDMGINEYNDSYNVRDMGYSGRLSPHRVASMERLPNDIVNSRDLYSGRGMPQNRSYIDSLGVLDDSEMPMSRAKSMMYLGDGDFEYPSYPSLTGDELHKSRQGSVSEISSTLRRSIPSETTKQEKEGQATSLPSAEKESEHRQSSPVPEWRQHTSLSPSSHEVSHTPERSLASTSPRPPHETSRSSERRASTSPHPDEDTEKRTHGKYRFPCRDFEKGVCSRGAACKFYHDPAKGRNREVIS